MMYYQVFKTVLGEEIEEWLQKQHEQGRKLHSMTTAQGVDGCVLLTAVTVPMSVAERQAQEDLDRVNEYGTYGGVPLWPYRNEQAGD